MRAVVVGRHGGPEVLDMTDRDTPEPGPGQVLVDVAASGVNYIDVYHRTGLYPTVPPFVLGVEGAGTVSAVGAGVAEPRVGDLVAWAGAPGGYAEQVALPADRVVPVPDGVSAEDAAAAMLQGITAQYLTASTYPVRTGDTVLVHAAAGGVGLLLIQLVKLRGGRVIGTVSTEAKEELARQAGADEVIRYTEVDFAARTRELTGGAGVAAVYDGVGRTTFDGSLASLAPRGMMALYGQASGPVPPLDLQRLNDHGSLFVTRPSLVHHVATRVELAERAGEVLGAVAAGRLTIRIGRRYPLAEAAAAHSDLEGRRSTGKLLLLPR
ncbi:MAG TPA: quinone oxidoreductase [Mycobacteriales bacterium]|nr:quinone oxidoreductase [Mycobacteriales bacterium]